MCWLAPMPIILPAQLATNEDWQRLLYWMMVRDGEAYWYKNGNHKDVKVDFLPFVEDHQWEVMYQQLENHHHEYMRHHKGFEVNYKNLHVSEPAYVSLGK